MVDPTGLLAPKTRREQELVVLYIIAVAGKTSEHAVNGVGRFMFFIDDSKPPFMTINNMSDAELMEAMRFAKISPYTIKHKAFRHAGRFWRLDRDLKSISPNEWANVGGAKIGIGPKTSRYICMCLDPENARYAALDTHLLKWMRRLGYDAPKSTPPAGPKYDALEAAFLMECDTRKKSPAAFDLEIWEAYKYGRDIPE